MAQLPQRFQRNHIGLDEGADPGAPQCRDPAETAKGAAEIAGEGPDIGAFATFGLEFGMVAVGNGEERQTGDLHRAGSERGLDTVAGEVIGALAFDLDRGKARRDLHQRAGERRQRGADRRFGGALGRHGGRCGLAIVGGRLLAPGDTEPIGLGSVHDVRNGLGRLAERDWQEATRQRIEGAGMAGLVGCEQALDLAHQAGRARPHRLVEHEPAMDRLAFAPRPHCGSLRVRLGVAMFEIASDLGTVEDLVDMGGIVERRVEAEAQVGHEFEIEPWGEKLADVAAVTLEGSEEGVLASGYERAYVNGGKSQIGRELHLDDGDTGMVDEVVGDIAMGEDSGNLMPYQLADPELALAWRPAAHSVRFTSSTRKHSMTSPTRMS